jgi:hypothetical protein
MFFPWETSSSYWIHVQSCSIRYYLCQVELHAYSVFRCKFLIINMIPTTMRCSTTIRNGSDDILMWWKTMAVEHRSLNVKIFLFICVWLITKSVSIITIYRYYIQIHHMLRIFTILNSGDAFYYTPIVSWFSRPFSAEPLGILYEFPAHCNPI